MQTLWGIDKSDHASLEAIFDTHLSKGPGMVRPDTSFLDIPRLADEFRNEFGDWCKQSNSSWDPHFILEFAKVGLRTLLLSHSKRFNNSLNKSLELTRIELNNLIIYKNKVANLKSQSLVDIEMDIETVKSKLDTLLTEKSRYLSARARVNWLEKGERSNKYFLNIIHRNNYSSYLSCFFNEQGTLSSNNEDKVKITYNFYSGLYASQPCLKPDSFFKDLNIPTLDSAEHIQLNKPITDVNLTKALRKCGNTASGPDGIGYKTIKLVWDSYSKILLNSWNYALQSGVLAPSHRESVICLLEKKGKDKRYMKNLRPISLSNCDLKIITKALTHKCNTVTNSIIHPMQAAYVPGRHDNLRLISIVKD